MTERPIFVWRGGSQTSSQGQYCRYCGHYIDRAHPTNIEGPKERFYDLFESAAAKMHGDHNWNENFMTGSGGFFQWHPYELLCTRCGWWASGITNYNGERFVRVLESILRNFELNDNDLDMDELVSHVSKRHDDIYSLTPRKFEELVAAVYSNQGWKVELTKQTRDGGADLVCLKRDTDEIRIVECKRYAKNRKVGLAAVDRLVGVSIRKNTNSAHLVTSSSFSGPARKAQSQAIENGVDLDLIDGYDLLKSVNAFANPDLTVAELEKIGTYGRRQSAIGSASRSTLRSKMADFFRGRR